MDARVSVVLATHNRREEALRAIGFLVRAGEAGRTIVVDNGSSDGTADAVAEAFPDAELVRLESNRGAAGRNEGARRARTPYVAFCDDDERWAPGAMRRAADLLERWPRLALVTARVLVGPGEREDPVCSWMAASPLPSDEVPGRAVAGFIAGASMVRREAFLAAGGYEPRFFIGGEEELLAADLMAAGWSLAYVPGVVVHHRPSKRRDVAARRSICARNRLWFLWLRRPAGPAVAETLRLAAAARSDPELRRALGAALAGLPWVLRRRRVVPPRVEALLRLASPTRP